MIYSVFPKIIFLIWFSTSLDCSFRCIHTHIRAGKTAGSACNANCACCWLTARKRHFRDKSTVFYRFVAKLPQNLSLLYFILAFSNLPLIVAVCEPISVSLSCRWAVSKSKPGSLWLTLALSGSLCHSRSFWLTLTHSRTISGSLRRSSAHKVLARLAISLPQSILPWHIYFTSPWFVLHA